MKITESYNLKSEDGCILKRIKSFSGNVNIKVLGCMDMGVLLMGIISLLNFDVFQ